MRRLLVIVAVVAGSSTACASSAPDSIGDRAASGPSVAVTTTAPAAPTMVASSPVPQTVRRASASTEPASTVAGGAAFDTSGLNAFVSAVATVQPRLDRPLSVRDIRVASPRAVLDGYEDSVVGVSATVQVGGGCAVRVAWSAPQRVIDVGRSDGCPDDGPAAGALANDVAAALDRVADGLLDEVYEALLPAAVVDAPSAVAALANEFPGIDIVDEPTAPLELRVDTDATTGRLIFTTFLDTDGCAHLRVMFSSNTSVERSHGSCEGTALDWASAWPAPDAP